jgi:hypothetical protein
MVNNRTFQELLASVDISELWYIISIRHNLPPIRAERLYKAYCGAREELLALSDGGGGGVLYCELVIEENDGGAPDVYFDCTISYAGDSEKYALDFIDWAEIVGCAVDDVCLQKYGALLVVAELLWEVTFYGYERKTVRGEADKLNESIAELETADRKPDTVNDFSFEPESEFDEQAATAWLSNAPDSVKALIFEKLKADVLAEDCDEISNEVFAEIVHSRSDESTYKFKGCDAAESLIRTMLNRLDYDDMAYLVRLLLA